MAEGGGPSLGNFYFDVIFRDKSQGFLEHVRNTLKSIDRSITINISSTGVNGDVSKIQQAINQKLANVKAVVPVLLNNQAAVQIGDLLTKLKGMTVELNVLLKNPTKKNLEAIQRAVRSMVVQIDVKLKEIDQAKIDALKKRAEGKLKLEATVNMNTARNSLSQALKSRPFKFDVVVDQMKVAKAVQAALTQAGYSGAGMTAAQARAQRAMQQQQESIARIARQNVETQAKIARQDAAQQAKTAQQAGIAAQRQATAAQQTAAAHARAQAAIARSTAAINRNTQANRQNAASFMLVRRSMLESIPLAGSLANMARNYVGVFGAVSAVRSLYRIRAEFERQEVALRALMQSASQAREVMGQLQQMALKSPFSVSDIVSFSKQLSAFSIGNNELVETTKRLADLSAGLGVDMSRLILAYGQVKAATVLRGQELRQFTEAGVPMVQALADQFTKLEGRVVTAADVFDRISKKAVSFEMVKQVLDSMTSEGGRFYDHQAKMVETLYGKMERLGDAYKVMMNQLGSSHDALLKAPIDAITKAMMDWRSTVRSIVTMLAASGVWKFMNYLKTPPQAFAGLQGMEEAALMQKRMTAMTAMYERGGLDKLNRGMQSYIMLSNTMTKTDWKNVVMKNNLSKAETMYLFTTGRLTKAHVEWIASQRKWNLAAQQSILNMSKMQLFGMRAGIAITRLAASVRAFAAQALPVAIISLFVDMISKAIQAKQEIDDFNKQVRESAKETVDDLRSYLDSHRDAFDLIVDPKVSQDGDTLQKTWEDLKQKIATLPGQELILGVVSDGADGDLKKLNANAIEFLRTMERVSDEINNMNTQMEYTQDTWVWGLFGEGVKSDVKDYNDKLKETRKEITAINDYLRHNKVNFELTIGGLDSSSVNDMREAIASAGAKEAWAGEAATRAASQLKEAYDEMSDEINASLRTSLLPVFEELRQKGITSPKEMAAAYQQIMPQIREAMGATTKEAQDTLDRLAMAMLRSNGFALDEVVLLGERAASDLRTSITREAEKMGVDINDIIESNNTDTMKALLDAAIANNRDISDDTRAQFNALRDYIMSHPATFRVIMRVETQEDGEARKFLKGLTGAKNAYQLAQQYGSSTPEGGDTNEKAIKRAKDNYESALERQQNLGRQLKNLEKQGKKNSQKYKDVKKSFDNEKKNADQAKKAYDDLGGDPADFQPKGKKGGKTGRKTGGKGTKRDEWLDVMRNRFAEYKEARAEVEKLRKMGMSEAKAIEEVMKMPWDYDLNKDYLGRGDAKALVDYLIPLVEQHGKGLQGSFKQANNKFLMELRKAQHDDQLKQYEEEAKKIGDAIKMHIETGVKQWKLYDALFAATGDEALSSTAAFGGKKLFENIEDQLIALFNKNEGKVDFSAALQMDEKTLSEKLLKNADEYIDLLKRIKEMRESGWSDVMTAAAKAMEDQMSMEEKLQKQRMLNQKQLAEFIKRNGGWMAVASNPELLSMFNALVKAGKEAEAELEAQAFELSDAWEQIFGDMTYKTYGQVKAARNLAEEIVRNATAASVGKDGRVKSYKSSYTDANGNLVELSNISPSQLERIKKAIDELFKTGKEKNAFATLGDTIKDIFETIRKGGKVSKETWLKLADGMSEVSKIGADLAGQLSEMFDAMGNEGMSETMDDLQAGLESVSNIGQGFAQGGLVGGIAAAAGEAIKWTTRLFRRHDAALQKIIENSKRKVAELQMSYEQVEKTIERILGGIYNARLDTAQRERLRNILEETKAVMGRDLTIHFEYVYSEESRAAAKKALSDGTAYSAMYANLLAQRDELNKQYDSESKKKKKDKDALIEYQKQMAELGDQIEHFAVDMANSLYGIDIKNWAKQLTDAVVNAWRNGENAVEAYRDKVKDIIAEVATSIISQKIMEAALQPVLDTLVAEMTAKNGLLDEGTIMTFATMLGNAGNTAVNTITGVLDALKAQGYDLTSGSAAGTLGQGIKEITEDQANLLASYINAMRADLSVVRMLWEQHALGLSVVSQAQLTELAAISANTLRNAEAAERIEAALGSVITVGASGARVRV